MTLHSEQDAIKQAVEAGYKPGIHISPCEIEGVEAYHKGDTLQDRAFWQALGKARGWKEEKGRRIADWLYYALRYFETLLSGGDRKAFWQSLP